jgi:hypothetical protein
MARHGIPHSNFIGFIADSAQANWNDVCIVYGSGDPKVLARHGIPHPNFIGFMVDNAQANWNDVRIVYGSGDPKVLMEGRERTCFFHWK